MLRSTWLKALPIALITLALASPVFAGTPRHFKRGGGAQDYNWGIGVRIGLFTPEGDSEFWDDTFDIFTGDIEDFEDTSLGFDVGEPDGIFGPATRSALSRFQQQHRFVADGHLDSEALEAVRRAALESSTPVTASDSS